MPSSTEGWVGAARDTEHLLRFRARTVRRRGPAVLGLVVVLALTVAFATFPARLDGAVTGEAVEILDRLVAGLEGNLALLFAGVLLLSIGSAMSSGGGRELLSRSEASIHPISPLTDHLGALVLAPLNLAWLVQVWGLLASTAIVTSPDRLAGAQVVVLAWVVAATAMGQVVGWLVEGVRRTPHGVLVVRVAFGAMALVLGVLHLTGRLRAVVDALPTTWVVETMATDRWTVAALALVVVTVVAGWVGGVPARWALALPPREELRVESGVHEARHVPTPRWGSLDLALMRRIDRGSVWRSVGMRRGLLVLGVGPGLVALVAGLPWSTVTLLPGLVASGGALLFAVNAWCLDGRGMIWRETLPVTPEAVFDARTQVIAECLAGVSAVTIALALLRNGLPPLQTGVAVATCWVVVIVQVLANAMTWSMRSPYGVDLSSPRATPAPHGAMAGYAGRLSLSTTVTGMLFTGLAAVPWVWVTPLFGALYLAWSIRRLRRARRRWLAPADRARVVLTVAAV